MIRIPLNRGEVVQQNNHKYVIDSVIGNGATCIVYAAHYTDTSGREHHVNIKECYPYNSVIIREQQDLKWMSEEKRTKDIEAFRDTYDKLMEMQNGFDLHNSTVRIFDLLEANQTLYSVMDVNIGITFDKDQCSLTDALKTVSALTKVVGKYHKNGYLHLDIKPGNFLVLPETRELIILFDVDSVTPIEAIRTGKVMGISYSEQWAAPEQVQGKISKLCPATDLYAIGAILFEKVMGRPVSNDDISIFADWDFDGPEFERENPKIKRLLRNVFHKTLAANVKRRWQNADELSAALDEIVRFLYAVKPYLISKCPPENDNFVGRNRELKEIHEAFTVRGKAVFLHGEGGIGKSSLAIAYGNKYVRDYDAVIFVRYSDSLTKLIEEASQQIQNFEGDINERKRMFLNLLDEHILLIVDNFDIAVDQESELNQLLQYHAHFLFTTRTDFLTVYDGEITQIEVGALPEHELIQIFEHSSELSGAEDQLDYLKKLLKYIQYNTYVTELLGNQTAASGWTPEMLYLKLKNGIDALSESEKVRTRKDGHVLKQTIPQIIRVLYRIANLNDDKKQVLRNLYLLRFLYLDKAGYRTYTGAKAREIDTLNDMCETGWVQYDGKYYRLHPLIEELVNHDLTPCAENCGGIFSYMSKCIEETLIKNGVQLCEVYFDRITTNCELLCMFFTNIDLQNYYHLQLALYWTINFISDHMSMEKEMTKRENMRIHSLHIISKDFFRRLFNQMEKSINIESISCSDVYFIYYNLLVAILVSDDSEKQIDRLFYVFDKSITATDSLELKDREECINYLYSTIATLIETGYMIPRTFIDIVYHRRPKAFADIKDIIGDEYGLILSDEECEDIQFEDKQLWEYTDMADDYEITEEDLFNRNSDLLRGILTPKTDIIGLVRQYISSHKEAPLNVARDVFEVLMYLKDTVILHCENNVFDDDTGWKVFEALLGIELKLLNNDECQDDEQTKEYCKNLTTEEEWTLNSEYVSKEIMIKAVECYLIVAYSANEKIEEYEDLITNYIDKYGKIDKDIEMLYILSYYMKQIHKSSWLLPFFIRYVVKREKASYDNSAIIVDCYPMYKEIVALTEEALKEGAVPEKYRNNFEKIKLQYKNRINSVIGKDVRLRNEIKE